MGKKETHFLKNNVSTNFHVFYPLSNHFTDADTGSEKSLGGLPKVTLAKVHIQDRLTSNPSL